MNILKSTTLTWYQVGALKWAVFLIGMAAGVTWSDFLAPYVVHMVVLGALLALYVTIVWLKQR